MNNHCPHCGPDTRALGHRERCPLNRIIARMLRDGCERAVIADETGLSRCALDQRVKRLGLAQSRGAA